ncbi:prolyl oligopeptidase family serine peptidase [Actinophytocola sp.]|uniref:dipeptidyl-peptidase 5 n=1 Tax=Actinophytocola sp. TaxID=1872138 RepID=UPI002D7E2F0A|nr:prolyl oligopeptidase family serine peptidase [Actinophytocola sp.]HET9138973.1 prolyl oligopeptidase family serine peptidase [Actinophytocola sp.]
MDRPRSAPYGRWASPITAADVAAGEALIEYVGFVGDEVWWVESRPAQGGRGALVRRRTDGTLADVLGPEWNVRTRVIEYGGRPWLALGSGPADGFVFTNWDDQRVYLARPDQAPTPISPRPELPAGARYADFTVVGAEVWCLRESITGPDPDDVHRDLVALPLDGRAARATGAVRVLAHSHHFMTGPRLAPDGGRVAWIGWDHPGMPWDGTELMCAPVLADGTLGSARRVTGGPGLAVGQVEWAPDRADTLYVLSDPDGWWNIHEIGLNGRERNLCPRAEEFGEALWRIGARWFLPAGDGRLFVVHGTGARRLAVLEKDGSLRDIGDPYTEWAALATDGRRVAATAAGPRHRRTVVLADPDHSGIEVLRPAELAHAAYLPSGGPASFTGPAGETVHAFVYPPHNPDFTAPPGELPPFLVHVHGGPTSRSQQVANLEIAFFTSRGIGVVDVQYGGSTGYGRDYRDRLRGNWGVVDVRDCATAARALAARGVADPDRIGIRGGSAGGWTSAASLAAHPELYRAAAIYYPVLDPVRWRIRGTHDFESRYLDSLIGPWPAARARYQHVSPLAHAHRIRTPFVLLQGLEDEICPPAQAQLLLSALRDRDVPHTYLAFAGEQHGFRKAETIIECLRAELALYTSVFTRQQAA